MQAVSHVDLLYIRTYREILAQPYLKISTTECGMQYFRFLMGTSRSYYHDHAFRLGGLPESLHHVQVSLKSLLFGHQVTFHTPANIKG
jgi:hypothetical protein